MHILDITPGSISGLIDPGVPVCYHPFTFPPKKAGRVVGGSTIYDKFTAPASYFAAIQLVHNFPGAFLSDEFQALLDSRINIDASIGRPLGCELPAGVGLYPWQEANAKVFAEQGILCVTDDPGTGKTFSAITAVLERHTRCGDGLPVVCVAPAAVVSSWVNAWKTLAPNLTINRYAGKGRKLSKAGVNIMSYDIARIDTAKLKQLKPKVVILDEHHMLKNTDSARTKAIFSAFGSGEKPHFITLSGTPIADNPGDFWPILHLIDPQTFTGYWRFCQRYCEITIDEYGYKKVGKLRSDMTDEFRLLLWGVMRRTTKRDALPFLPPKVYSVREVELPTKWRKVYDSIDEKMVAELPDGEVLLTPVVVTKLMALQRIASGPCTVRYEPDPDPETPDHLHIDMLPGGWKLDAMLEIIEERPNQQCLVFAQSKQLVDAASTLLEAAGVTTCQVVGGQSARQRDEAVRLFQTGQRRVCLLTTQAGGVGITLTAASTVIFLQRPFSLVDSVQAEDRAHRIGSEQHTSVEIIDVVAAGTVDGYIREVLHRKGGSLGLFMADPGFSNQLLGGIK